MQFGKFNLVVGGQWGSEGKGMASSALADRNRPEILSTTNMPNAGHTAVDIDGVRKFVGKVLPAASVLSLWRNDYRPHIVIGASAAFRLDRFMDEMQDTGLTVNGVTVHERAGIVTDDHARQEASDAESPGSTKHVASTMQGCGAFLAEKVLRKKGLRLARDVKELERFLPSHMGEKIMKEFPAGPSPRELPEMLCELMSTHGWTVLHEGAQGFSLDINHGSHYPQCTSRGTTAGQMAADMGVSARMVGDVYLVIRPYPIRVGNVSNEEGAMVGYSGDAYEGQAELTWEEVAKRAGAPEEVTRGELTTVTKRLRRVFEFSPDQLRKSALVNGATKLVLNFANYIDWSCHEERNWCNLPSSVMDFVEWCEEITKVEVTAVGTGARTCDMAWRENN